MASVRVMFRPSTVEGKEGTLYFRVIHERVARTVFTDCHVFRDEWDDVSSSVIIAGTKERKAYLELTASKLKSDQERLDRIIAEKEVLKVKFTADDVVTEYRKQPEIMTFSTFIRSMAEKKMAARRYGTAKTYRNALASFSNFRNGEDVSFDALDKETICQYEAWMKDKGLKLNTSSCYLRTLKTLYLKAVDMGLTEDKDVFSRVFTGFATTAKRAITIDGIKKILKLRLKDGSALAFARDMFMLSFYLQGISFVDMAYLKKTDIRNGLLQYSRKKTGQTITISWEREMQEIVDAYSHLAKDTPYLLPIIRKLDGTEREQYEKAEHNVNRNLKKIGVMACLHIPLTTYVSRHSWASIMRDMGNDISVISRGLGHEDIKTTQIYLSAIDNSTVMKANKRLIGRITKH